MAKSYSKLLLKSFKFNKLKKGKALINKLKKGKALIKRFKNGKKIVYKKKNFKFLALMKDFYKVDENFLKEKKVKKAFKGKSFSFFKKNIYKRRQKSPIFRAFTKLSKRMKVYRFFFVKVYFNKRFYLLSYVNHIN